jgi:xanthine dehydrogenase accessory factor
MDEALEQAAVATVVATRSSAPRPVGSKLIVRGDGSFEGSVSNGCVESDVMLAAQEVLAGAEPRLITYGITDEMAFGVGLPCGGEIDVLVEPYRDAEADVVLTVVAGGDVGEKLRDPALEQAARRRGRSHVFEHEGRTVFADVSAPPPRVFVYGAIDTAEALCAAAKLLGWRTIVADARPRFATPERLPSADELLVLWPDEALAHVAPDPATAVVVLTHDDKFDLPLVRGALATEAFYLGWLGSRRNQERRRGLLLEEGVAEEDLDRISGPAGLDLGAGSREETAVSILAEILAVRSGRSGGLLRETSTRIHA